MMVLIELAGKNINSTVTKILNMYRDIQESVSIIRIGIKCQEIRNTIFEIQIPLDWINRR